MIVESSAVMALLLGEPEADRVEQALAAALRADLPASCYLECSLVMAARFGGEGLARLDRLVEQVPLRVVPFTEAHARAAREAYLRFGKGRHPARLNFGDCMSYAVARVEGLPLLYVGEDFGRTDVARA